MLWEQKDAPSLIQSALQDALDDDGVLVRFALPKGWTPRKGPNPVITVGSAGSQLSPRGTDVELVRVTVHSDQLPRARQIMQRIDAWLLTPKFQFLGCSILRGRGLGLTSGPNSLDGGFMATCTYAVATTRRVTRATI